MYEKFPAFSGFSTEDFKAKKGGRKVAFDNENKP